MHVLIILTSKWKDDRALGREIARLPTGTMFVILKSPDPGTIFAELQRLPERVYLMHPEDTHHYVTIIRSQYNGMLVHYKR